MLQIIQKQYSCCIICPPDGGDKFINGLQNVLLNISGPNSLRISIQNIYHEVCTLEFMWPPSANGISIYNIKMRVELIIVGYRYIADGPAVYGSHQELGSDKMPKILL